VLKTPTTVQPGPAGQQAFGALQQQADTLESQIASATDVVNVTDFGSIGALVIKPDGQSGTESFAASSQFAQVTNDTDSSGASQFTQGTNTLSSAESQEVQEAVQLARANPNVAAVVQDRVVTIDAQILPTGENRKDADWSPRPGRSGDGIDNVNVDIAIIDTGVQRTHPDLNVFRCVAYGYANCEDGNGHGTHVAGTAAARDNNVGVVGAAPGARIWAVKVLSDAGSGSFSDILAGINYVYANRAQIETVNLSLGCHGTAATPCTFAPAENALRLLANSGVTVVISGGNNAGNALYNTPARAGLNFPGVITVSAIGDSDGRCGGYGPATSRGPDDTYADFSAFNVDIAAPGVDILSTYKGSTYVKMSGTSMASPDVAGAAAYYKSLFPTMTPAQIEQALKTAGTKRPASGNGLLPCDGHGRGYVRNDAHNHAEPLLYMGLTGVYKANDGGTYYFRQNGPVTLYWAGLSNNGAGTSFTNVFRGVESGNPSTTISGPWCDVPRGTFLNCGSLTIKMTSPTTFSRTADGGYLGGFGGTLWTRQP
jgi:subtilisin family serine protease